MSNFVKKFPGLSQFLLAFLIGTAFLLPVNAGLLPKGFFYLAAFSASISGIGLTALVSGKAVLWTCLLNNTKGSILLACALHAGEAWVLSLWNISNPASFIGAGIAMTIIAIVVVVIFGPQNLSRTNKRYIIEDK